MGSEAGSDEQVPKVAQQLSSGALRPRRGTTRLDSKDTQYGEEGRGSCIGPAPVPTHMGDADATVDGEGCCQVLIELAEPWSVDLVHQLSHTDDLWEPERG